MKIKNYTNIDIEKIRQIIRAVRPNGISNFDVRISNKSGNGVCGRAYMQGSSYHDSASPFIVVRVARTDAKARGIRSPIPGKGYLPHNYGNRTEAMLFVIAHELRHLWQAKHKRGKVYGARGRYSERDADAYAIRMLRAYRRNELF